MKKVLVYEKTLDVLYHNTKKILYCKSLEVIKNRIRDLISDFEQMFLEMEEIADEKNKTNK